MKVFQIGLTCISLAVFLSLCGFFGWGFDRGHASIRPTTVTTGPSDPHGPRRGPRGPRGQRGPRGHSAPAAAVTVNVNCAATTQHAIPPQSTTSSSSDTPQIGDVQKNQEQEDVMVASTAPTANESVAEKPRWADRNPRKANTVAVLVGAGIGAATGTMTHPGDRGRGAWTGAISGGTAVANDRWGTGRWTRPTPRRPY